jgi:hypothetical protein
MDVQPDRGARFILIVTAILLMAGCAHKPAVKEEPPPGTYMEDIYTIPNPKSDLDMFRKALPPYLSYMESQYSPSKDDDKTLCRISGTYYAYAYCFMEDKDRKEASRLYLKGRDVCLNELKYYRIFNQALTYKLSADAFRQSLTESFPPAKIPVVYWAAMNWTGWICLNLSKPEALEDIPRVEAMLEYVNASNDSYANGSVHAALGVLYAAQPKGDGGDLNRSKDEFDKAFACSFSSTLTYQVMYARYYAYGSRSRVLFKKTLESVAEKPADFYTDMNFVNEVAKVKANLLLKNINKFFKQPAKKTGGSKTPQVTGGAAPKETGTQEAAKAAGSVTPQATSTQEAPKAAGTETPQATGTQEAPKATGSEAPQTTGGQDASKVTEGENPQKPGGEEAPKAAGTEAPRNTGTEEAPKAAVGEAPQNAGGVEAPNAAAGDATQKTAGEEAPKATMEEATQKTGAEEAPKAAGGEAPQDTTGVDAPKAPGAEAPQNAGGEEAPKTAVDQTPPQAGGSDAPAAAGDDGVKQSQ